MGIIGIILVGALFFYAAGNNRAANTLVKIVLWGVFFGVLLAVVIGIAIISTVPR
jgi:hypothetical protein